jgi:hypothetical protein
MKIIKVSVQVSRIDLPWIYFKKLLVFCSIYLNLLFCFTHSIINLYFLLFILIFCSTFVFFFYLIFFTLCFHAYYEVHFLGILYDIDYFIKHFLESFLIIKNSKIDYYVSIHFSFHFKLEANFMVLIHWFLPIYKDPTVFCLIYSFKRIEHPCPAHNLFILKFFKLMHFDSHFHIKQINRACYLLLSFFDFCLK